MREVCFQREMRDREALAEPREQDSEIDYTIGPIGADEATAFIKRYEWLGTPGHPIERYCARNGLGEVAAVALFGRPTVQSAALCRKITPNSINPEKIEFNETDRAYFNTVACLERGACAHWAHPHTGSWFIPRALHLAHEQHGWEIFYAYSDEEAGEIGTIYQACNWHYLGLGLTRYLNRKKQPQLCRWVFRRMDWPENKWVQSREFYSRKLQVSKHVAVHINMDGTQTGWDAKKKDWKGPPRKLTKARPWIRREAIPKHKYVQFVGDKATRRKCLKALRYKIIEPYPKRKKLDLAT